MGKPQLKDIELLHKTVHGLKTLRTERKVTQEDFYNDTGIHIARIETGKVNLSLSTLNAVLRYYEVPLSVFFASIER